jgi:saxitoxin biosynthesis operon SxtJ-like protein
MKSEMTNPKLRSFGLTVGGIFALIGVWPVIIRGAQPRWWALLLAICLIVPALLAPGTLLWPHKGWTLFGETLGWINTRIILGFVFFVIVTPIGMIRRWMGKDPMGRKLEPKADTYRVSRSGRPASHLKRQY